MAESFITQLNRRFPVGAGLWRDAQVDNEMNHESFTHHLREANWRILRRCGARCVMCDQWQDKEWKEKEFPEEKILQLLDEMHALGVEHVRINGGEPTLHPSLPLMVKTAKGLGMRTELVSHCGFLDKALCRKLASAGLDCVAWSLDGLEETHDRIRGVPGLFKRAVRGIKMLQIASPAMHITVNCVVQRKNQADLLDIVRLCKQLRISAIDFSQVDVLGTNTKLNNISAVDSRLNPGQMRRFFFEQVPAMLRLADGMQMAFNPFFHQLINLSPSEIVKELSSPLQFEQELSHFSSGRYGLKFYTSEQCRRPWNALDIAADGSVYPCCNMLGITDYQMGNIYPQSLRQIWAGEHYQRFREQLLKRRTRTCFRCKDFFGLNKGT